jgi:hypothetical protein
MKVKNIVLGTARDEGGLPSATCVMVVTVNGLDN